MCSWSPGSCVSRCASGAMTRRMPLETTWKGIVCLGRGTRDTSARARVVATAAVVTGGKAPASLALVAAHGHRIDAADGARGTSLLEHLVGEAGHHRLGSQLLHVDALDREEDGRRAVDELLRLGVDGEGEDHALLHTAL